MFPDTFDVYRYAVVRQTEQILDIFDCRTYCDDLSMKELLLKTGMTKEDFKKYIDSWCFDIFSDEIIDEIIEKTFNNPPYKVSHVFHIW